MPLADSDPQISFRTTPADCAIFVVDDDPTSLLGVGRAIEVLGYPVTTFGHPQDVLDALPYEGLTLLISDRDMPDIDGIELARLVLELDPDLAVIILTGTPTASSVMESLRLGVVEYLQKPPSIELLAAAVRHALALRIRNILSRGGGS